MPLQPVSCLADHGAILPMPGLAKAGTFFCQEDKEHTARCVMAIRARDRRVSLAVLIDIQTGLPR